VELGLSLKGVRSALNVERGMEMLHHLSSSSTDVAESTDADEE
jgi:hypothetical protein